MVYCSVTLCVHNLSTVTSLWLYPGDFTSNVTERAETEAQKDRKETCNFSADVDCGRIVSVENRVRMLLGFSGRLC